MLGVIPARRGSKGLAGKNIRPLAGGPLLILCRRGRAPIQSVSFPVKETRLKENFSPFLLSTVGEDIAAVGRAWGIEAPFLRPLELATDEAPTVLVLRHAAEWIEHAHGVQVSAVVTLQPLSATRGE